MVLLADRAEHPTLLWDSMPSLWLWQQRHFWVLLSNPSKAAIFFVLCGEALSPTLHTLSPWGRSSSHCHLPCSPFRRAGAGGAASADRVCLASLLVSPGLAARAHLLVCKQSCSKGSPAAVWGTYWTHTAAGCLLHFRFLGNHASKKVPTMICLFIFVKLPDQYSRRALLTS